MEILNTVVKNHKECEDLIDVDIRLQLEHFAEKLKEKRIAMVKCRCLLRSYALIPERVQQVSSMSIESL